MNGLDLMADTNALIYFLNGDRRVLDVISNNIINISFITEIELLSKPGISKKEEKIITDLVASCIILSYSEPLKDLIISYRKNRKLKMGDALIAATANYYQLPLITADKDFSAIDDITCIQIN